MDGIERHQDLPGFLAEVGRISGRTPEQARYQAEATIAALAEQDGDLVESLHVPDGLRDLLNPPEAGGGLVGASTTTPTLDADEISAALADLPYWAGDSQGLYRGGRAAARQPGPGARPARPAAQDNRPRPEIGRPDPDSAVLTVRTSQADGVTALDVDLAHQIDDAIEEAGAGDDRPSMQPAGPAGRGRRSAGPIRPVGTPVGYRAGHGPAPPTAWSWSSTRSAGPGVHCSPPGSSSRTWTSTTRGTCTSSTSGGWPRWSTWPPRRAGR